MSIDAAWLQATFPNLSNLTPLNAGGQKWVFSGTHPTHGEIVLKFFHPATDPDRARREVEAVVKIQSPRVPKIHEVGVVTCTIGSLIWVLEQRLDGQNLRERLQTGPFDPASVMRLALHVLEALNAAEQNHIVHRDVKPENIMVDRAGNYWLLDFGLARHLDKESLTATGAPFGVGTLGYSPSEQFRNRKDDIDGRADLFALGVTLYECVQGVNPFRQGARDPAEVLRRVETQPLPPTARQIDAANQFRDLVQAMSRTRRDQRPANIAEALAWIQEICRDNGIA
jgi:serine/threonine-protein kinase